MKITPFSYRISLVAFLLLAGLVLSACGSQKSVSDGDLPTLAATSTSAPHVTATPLPVSALSDVALVDWDETSHFAAAMRSDYVSDIDEWVDGDRYYIEADVELNATAALITGSQRGRYVNKSQDTLDTVVFRLYPNLPAMGGIMRIESVKIDDQEVDFEVTERSSVLVVNLPEPLAPGEASETVINFVTVAERGMNASYGRFGYQLDLLAAPGWHPVFSVYEPNKNGWWMERASPQGDPHYATTALYEVYLTHAEKLVTAVSGVTIDEVDNGDGTVTEHIVTGPMRYSIIIASPVIGKVSEEVDGTTVNVYYLPGDERASAWGLEVGVDSVAAFNRQFGDYPYAELDIVETFTISGVEFPGVVVITNNSWENGSAGMQVTVSHEVAHQWWYGLVGNDQINNPWVDESLTTFSESSVYWPYAYEDGVARAHDRVQGSRNGYNFFRGSAGAVDLPMNLPVTAYPSNQYGVLIYSKGVVFYDELEREIGREALMAGLQSYFAEMKYDVAYAGDILRHMEAASGQELDAFFYEWIGDFEGLDLENENAPSAPAETIIEDAAAVDWNNTEHFAQAMHADYATDIDEWVDGNRYFIEASVDLNTTNAIVSGSQRAKYVNTSEDTLDTVVFRLYPNSPEMGGDMQIQSVKIDDQAVDFALSERDTVLTVTLPDSLEPSEYSEIIVNFVLKVNQGANSASYGRFGYSLDLLAAPGWHPVFSVYDPEKGGWWIEQADAQGDPHYATTALYEISLTHSIELTTIISGVTIDETQNEDGTVTEHIVTGPMRYSILMASPTIGKISDIVDDTTVNVYYLDGDESGAPWALDVGLDSMRIFNEQFGQYPYSELDIVETFTVSGVEFPGVIVITNDHWNNGNVNMQATVAHEVAHQWWYSVVGNDQVNYPWLDESLTTFSEASVYWRNIIPGEEEQANARVRRYREWYEDYINSPNSINLPMNLPVNAYNAQQYGPLIYGKGAVFYTELETEIGREALMAGLQAYFADQKYDIASTADILRHMEDASGQELDAFFYEWLGDFEGLDPAVIDDANNDDDS